MADPTVPGPGTPGPDPSIPDPNAGRYVPAAEPGPPIGGSRRGGTDAGRATPPPPLPPGGAPVDAASDAPATPAVTPAQPASPLHSGVPAADAPTAAASADPRPAQPGQPRAEKHATPPRWAVQDAEPPAGGAGSGAGAAGGSPTPPRPKSQDSFSQMLDQVGYLIMDGRDYVRQETEYIFRDKVAKPMTEVGVTLGAFFAAMMLLLLGMVFIAVAGIVWLSFLVGVPLAFLIIGVILLIGSGVFLAMKANQVRHSAEELKRATAKHDEGKPAEPVVTKKKAKPAPAPKPQHAPSVPTDIPGR